MPRRFDFETCDSTNERALAALAAGEATDGDLFVARAQTAGRGRLGRPWHAAPGENLTVSLVHAPPPPTPPLPALTMAAGLAVLDALAAPGLLPDPVGPSQVGPDRVGSGARLRWPNDVEVDGAKLAGILIEARDLAPRRPRFVVGIGINVRQTRFPAALLAERRVTSLALLGSGATPADVLAALVTPLQERLRTAHQAPDALASAYLEATGLAGAPVRLRAGGETIEGLVRALTLRPGLTVETPAGPRVVALEHLAGVELLPREALRDAAGDGAFDTRGARPFDTRGGARPASL